MNKLNKTINVNYIILEKQCFVNILWYWCWIFAILYKKPHDYTVFRKLFHFGLLIFDYGVLSTPATPAAIISATWLAFKISASTSARGLPNFNLES